MARDQFNAAEALWFIACETFFRYFGRAALERLRAEAEERRTGGALDADTF